MIAKRIIARLFLVFCAVTMNCQAQGTFQNLNFEAANLVAVPGGIAFGQALPNWAGFVGGVPQSAVLSNSYYLDTSGITIVTMDWPGYFDAGVISGGYSVLLQAGLSFSVDPVPADVSLAQSGTVPVTAQALYFRAYPGSVSGFLPLRVFIGGQNVSFTPLSTDPKSTLFGADIRPWQGIATTVDFTLLAQRPHFGNNYMFLDSIQFSDLPIPEPSSLSLLVLSALLLGKFRRRMRG